MLEGMDFHDTPNKEYSFDRCKPDYEGMIKRANEKLSKNNSLSEALFNYAGNNRLRGKMAELAGELVSESRLLNNEISNLIEKQEKDSGE